MEEEEEVYIQDKEHAWKGRPECYRLPIMVSALYVPIGGLGLGLIGEETQEKQSHTVCQKSASLPR